VAALAACGGASAGGGGGGVGGGGVSGGGGGAGSGSGSVTGTISWPNGDPAAGASVYFYNYDPGFTPVGWSDGQYEVQQLPADGSYSLGGCPCQDLTAYVYVPATAGADPQNGGQACWIIMQDENQNFSGRPANPGDVINWQALDLPCSPTWYTSDQSTVQSEYTAVLPYLNSGTWQAAETRTSASGG